MMDSVQPIARKHPGSMLVSPDTARARHGWVRWLVLACSLAVFATAGEANETISMKLLIVNPSQTEVKEFSIRNPLPPEVKPEHVLDADGLKVEYDSQAGTYVIVGTVTLKPRESLTKRIVLEDVWVIPDEQFAQLRREIDDIMQRLQDTPYLERGRILASAMTRRIAEVQESQQQPFLQPEQHITLYRENVKTLQMAESDMVSLRQLMVMAALNPSANQPPLVVGHPTEGRDGASAADSASKGGLSILSTWRMIFLIIGLLAFVSLSFFLVWQRQLKAQLAKQTAAESEEDTHALERLAGGERTPAHPQPPTSS